MSADLSLTRLQGAFYERLNIATGQGWLDALAMRIDSSVEIETYRWLGQVPAMREWVGGRNAKAFRTNGFTVANKRFEATTRVTLDEIRRDQTAQVMVRINELADRAAGHPASLISQLILNGATGLCYDGQYFFDTDHTEGDNSTNQSNSVTFDISDAATHGTATVPAADTMARAIMQGVSAILGFKDDQNEPCNENAANFLVMVPPVLMAPTMAAIYNPALDTGATNVLRAAGFNIRPAVNARLTFTDKFAVFCTDGSQKPFINQVEQDVTLSAKAVGSEFEHDNDAHEYGVKRIGNAAYGDWKKACLVTMQA